MALTATVTKKSVTTGQQAKLWQIVFNLIIKDNDVEVINQDVSCEYRTGENVVDKVIEVKNKMQLVVNDYKSAQVIFNAAALDTAVTAIQGGLAC
jgi:hypothetical protein